MTGLLSGLIEVVKSVLAPLVEGAREAGRRINWFLAALAASVVALLAYLVEWFEYACTQFQNVCQSLVSQLDSLTGAAGGSSGWGALSGGAALMNCIVPLDTCLTVGGILFATWVGLQAWRFSVFVYRLIPFKLT